MQLRCQRLTLAAFGCQSITYVCSQRRLLDTGQQHGQRADGQTAGPSGGRTDRQTELPYLVQRLQCEQCGTLQ